MEQKIYITQQGDTWDKIAKKVYGNEFEVKRLLEANMNLVEVVQFSSNQKVICPLFEITNQIPVPKWRL